MHILTLIIKDTGTLDYVTPLLWRVRRLHPQARVTVLYWMKDKSQVLRQSHFYSDLFRQLGVREVDLTDSAPRHLRAAEASLRLALRTLEKAAAAVSRWRRRPGPGKAVSGSDVHAAAEADPLPHARSVAREPGVLSTLRRKGAATLLQSIDTIRGRQIAAVLPALRPDIVLLDHRSGRKLPGQNCLSTYFNTAHKPVVLLPHAPNNTGTDAFVPFLNNKDRPLPDYCDYWMPFKPDRIWEKLPAQKHQFSYVGYPGLDSEWLDFLKGRGKPARDGSLRCLFIIRKFFRQGQKRPPGHDLNALEYDEFSHIVQVIKRSIQQANADVEIVIKPHPSTKLELLRELFASAGIPRWSIAHDSIYSAVADIDFVISLYSTALLIPAMMNIPTVLLHCTTQDALDQWPDIRQLYHGLRFYLEDPEHLLTRLPEVLALVQARREAVELPPQDDIRHLREYYPDGAMQRALDRLGMSIQ